MAVVSRLHEARVPVELEQMIISLVIQSREPREMASYIGIAQRMKEWMEPLLYRKINISSEIQARRLLKSLTARSKTVLYLHVNFSVSPHTIALLLHRCPHLINFVLHGGSNQACRFQWREVLDALDNLTNVRYLSVDPTLFFQTCFMHLPDLSAFHRVTHLNLTTHWALEIIMNGFQYLHSLTHVSMAWNTGRAAAGSLLALLGQPNLRLILLWLNEIDDHPKVVRKLRKKKLDDQRVVLLH